MKILTILPHYIRLSFVLFAGIIIYPSVTMGQNDCAVSRDHGQGYTTSIADIIENEDSSYTIVLIVEHDGASGPGFKKMNYYSVEADPGTYSDISVQTLSGNFTYGSIVFGPNIGGSYPGFKITGTNQIGPGQAASFSVTYTLTGGFQDQQTKVKAASNQLLAGFTIADFQAVFDCMNPVAEENNIIPYYAPPEGGKVYDLIGAELTSLYYTFINTGTYISDDIFQIVGTGVLIDIVVNSGQYNAALALLTSPSYGLSSASGNPDDLMITGIFPIENLLMLNDLPVLINFARPVYTALGNAGIVTSQGDVSMRTYLARGAFDVNGQGVKIGVLSDSYNTVLGNPASDDVTRGDLPGAGNPLYPTPVDLVMDYPYGSRTDEGRAMLQIIHDIAPGAELAFRTGFLGPADFASGIIELQQAGCDIIVDDITYISEPFFRDGIVAKAVDSVTSLGVSYFSAAGNFGSKTYESVFYPASAPGISGEAHNFAFPYGAYDAYQGITLAPGNYTVVLQWDDGTPGNVTGSDFDIYLASGVGTTLFGFNRVNTGGAPIEVLPFTVVNDTSQSNFIIVRTAGTGPATIKYIVFRGDIQVNDFGTNGGSTLVGQANAAGAIAVGAVLFSNTPEFGVDPPTAASFSSRGGTPVNGVNRNKPDIMAPNGVNTTVNFGGPDIDGDAFPNFFGTSASAPHAAAVAALIQQARQKYYGSALSPSSLKNLLQNTAIDMYTPGYDAISGAGFINSDGTLGSLANPVPFITGISYDTTLTPGLEPVEITIFGQYLSDEAMVYFNGLPLDSVTVVIGDSSLVSTIPVFEERYPLIQVYNPPMAGTNGTDGGFSAPLYFTTKETIVIEIDDQMKKYGEALPEFTAQYFLESLGGGNIPLDSAGLTTEEVDRIHSIAFETAANALSNTGFWEIIAGSTDPLISTNGLPVTDSLDISLLERFNIDVESGILTIEKLDLVISPRDTTIVYGDSISSFAFDFSFNNDSINLDFGYNIEETDSLAILSGMQSKYATALVNGAALVFATALVNESALINKSMMIPNATFNKFATALVNGTFIGAPSFATATALVNVLSFTGSSTIAPATALVNGEVIVNSYDSTGVLVNSLSLNDATALVNAFGGATALVNTNTVNANSNSDALMILGGDDISILAGDSTGVLDMKGICLITGNTVGQHYILPGSFVSNNFNISYGLGTLTIVPAMATVEADLAWITQGDSLPAFTAGFSGFVNGEDESVVDSLSFTISPAYEGYPGTYQIIPAAYAANYVFSPLSAPLYVNPCCDGASPIMVYLDCVRELDEPDSLGYGYIAHFAYENNSFANVYIPESSDNYFSGNGSYHPINQPELFLTGNHSFSVPFDGDSLTWIVSSFNSNGIKYISSVMADLSSDICEDGSKSAEAEPAVTLEKPLQEFSVYPNPTTGMITLVLKNTSINADDLMIYDIYGQAMTINVASVSGDQAEIDLSGYAAGIYFIRLGKGDAMQVARIIRK